jgi:ribonucleotide reductase beta subunit family protein with ferritin-like domain
MSGTNQFKITVTLRNPLDHKDLLEYYIIPDEHQLAQDWVAALTKILQSNNLIEKNFCFLGFPKTSRTLDYLCNELNTAIETINNFDFTQHGLENYIIEEWFHPNTVRFPETYKIEGTVMSDQVSGKILSLGLQPKHMILNQLHNHFERLQGTVNHLSEYYRVADYATKYAIRQLNIICHEMESLILSQRKLATTPEWVRPSQITTWLQAPRLNLKSEHREGFLTNGYDRVLGGVYMHWTQIGKTYFEVFRDENASKLTDTVCEAITSLKYYSGEFDIEWGNDVVKGGQHQWHNKEIDQFTKWIIENNLNPEDPNLSLGYLPLGQVELIESFGTTNTQVIWQMIGSHLDIYKVEVDEISATYDYCWSDLNYEQTQIEEMKDGYDYSSKNINK